MNKINSYFTTFMISILKLLLVILAVVSIGTIFTSGSIFSTNALIIVSILGGSSFIGWKVINKEFNNNVKVGVILGIAFILRLLWILNVNSTPTSDFKTIYECATKLIDGDTSAFWGTSYIARFPHLTIMVLYMAMMQKLFPVGNILAMKIVNLVLGVVVVYFIYLIISKIFENKKYGLIGMLIGSIFPPLISYTAVFCTEDIAIPFYLASIYLFLLVVKDRKSSALLILSGVLISVGNLFRMVGIIVVIAYSIYLLIYYDNKLIVKLKNIAVLVVSYGLVLVTVSGLLQAMKITEYPLWDGSEPGITNVLKGTNYESGGRWNEEDAALPEACNYEYEVIEEASKQIIIERLTTTSPIKLLGFYVKKFALQWNEGDLSGVFWSELEVEDNDIILKLSENGYIVLQVIYVLVIGLILIGLFNKKLLNNNQEIKLFYLILCGYGASYLITESQPRYSYIACWVFIILAMVGVNKIKDTLVKR